MAGIRLAACDIAALEAAIELLPDNLRVRTALTSILVKQGKADERAKGMSFRRFAEIANEEMGSGKWSVESIARTTKLIRQLSATEDHLRIFFRYIIATYDSPWDGLGRHMVGFHRIVDNAIKEGSIHAKPAITGVISDL
jgi:hypothetical protein